MERHTGRAAMAHVIVRRDGERYVAQLADDGALSAVAESPAKALRAIRRLLGERVNNSSTPARPSR